MGLSGKFNLTETTLALCDGSGQCAAMSACHGDAHDLRVLKYQPPLEIEGFRRRCCARQRSMHI